MAERGTIESEIERSDEERQVEKQELDVNELGMKIGEYRDTLSNQLTSALALLLRAQRLKTNWFHNFPSPIVELEVSHNHWRN